MTGATPRLTDADAVEIGATLFGVRGARRARPRQRARPHVPAAGRRRVALAVLKVSNAAEDPEVLDMEAAAALHVTAVDPGLRRRAAVAARRGEPGPARAGRRPGAAARPLGRALGAALRRAARQQPHLARRAVRRRADRLGRDDGAARRRRCAGSSTRSAQRVMPWDVQHALDGPRDARRHPRSARASGRRPGARRVRAARHAGLAAAARAGRPRRPDRRQHAHRRGRLHHRDHRLRRHEPHGAVTDLASVLDSLGGGREGAELFRAARLVLDGYQRRVPLEDARARGARRGVGGAQRADDRDQLVARRAGASRTQAFAERFNAECLRDARDDRGRRLGRAAARGSARPARGAPTRRWRRRRAAAFGPAIDPLFYAEPIEVASAAGRVDHRHRRPHATSTRTTTCPASGTRTRA